MTFSSLCTLIVWLVEFCNYGMDHYALLIGSFNSSDYWDNYHSSSQTGCFFSKLEVRPSII